MVSLLTVHLACVKDNIIALGEVQKPNGAAPQYTGCVQTPELIPKLKFYVDRHTRDQFEESQ